MIQLAIAALAVLVLIAAVGIIGAVWIWWIEPPNGRPEARRKAAARFTRSNGVPAPTRRGTGNEGLPLRRRGGRPTE
jgi:hypothetical protein